MATTTQTYGASGWSAEQVAAFYDKVLLERALPNLVHAQFGQKGRSFQIPDRQGLTINFRKFGSLSAATTALSEGVTPVGTSISPSAITATVDQYGSWIQYSDLIDKLSIDPIVTEMGALLGSRIN
jgi:N4-gp56 family major capsid protein